MSTPQSPENPYAATPKAGAPAPFEYGHAQAAMAVPTAKRSKGKKALSVLGVLLIFVVIAVVKFGIRDALTDKPVHAKVGQCVKVTGTEKDPKVDTIGCDDANATHTVEKVIDKSFDVNACGDEFDALAQQLGSDKFVLCLTPKK